MSNQPNKPNEIFEQVIDALSDKTIDELDKLTPYLLTHYITYCKNDKEEGKIRNIIMRSNNPVNTGITDINCFHYNPVESNHTDITNLKTAIENGNTKEIINLLKTNSTKSGDQDIRRIASIVLEHQINTIIKKSTFGASIMIQNAIGKMLDGEHLLDRIKLQVFIEILCNEKIYYHERIMEIDKNEFLENPLSLMEHSALDNSGIRSADGSGKEFHKQLFGSFAELIYT